MTTPSEQSRATGSYPLFDWLRFILASTVALTHENIVTWENAGNFAVQVFFALSGWLIGGILIRTELRKISAFYYNRGTRIWIPYVLAVAAIYSLSAIREPTTANYFKFLFYDGTFTHNWFIPKIAGVVETMPLHGTGSHFWSISVEEQFYLAAPLLIVLLPFGRSVTFWVLIALVATLSKWWYGAISLGVLASVLRFHYGDWQLQKRGFAAICALTVASVLIMVLAPPSYGWSAPLVAVSVVLMTSWQGSRGRVGKFVGGMSYPLYLYHWTGMFAAHLAGRHFGISPIYQSWGAYFVAVAVGSTAYIAVDKNILKWRSKIYRPIIGRSFMVTAYTLLTVGVVGGVIMRLSI